MRLRFVKKFSDPIDRGSVRGAKAWCETSFHLPQVWAVELKRHLAEQLRAGVRAS